MVIPNPDRRTLLKLLGAFTIAAHYHVQLSGTSLQNVQTIQPNQHSGDVVLNAIAQHFREHLMKIDKDSSLTIERHKSGLEAFSVTFLGETYWLPILERNLQYPADGGRVIADALLGLPYGPPLVRPTEDGKVVIEPEVEQHFFLSGIIVDLPHNRVLS